MKENPPIDLNALGTLHRLLEECPMGMSEYELIQKLRADQTTEFVSENFTDNLTLFQSHFLLFHHLYLLQSQLWNQKSGSLEVSALNIRLADYQEIDNSLRKHDALRGYYLEIRNLENSTLEEIDTMLKNFWRRYLSPEGRKSALQELGLQDPVDDQTIKRSYRRLAMAHHPDRGGDKERLQTVNAAIRFLLG